MQANYEEINILRGGNKVRCSLQEVANRDVICNVPMIEEALRGIEGSGTQS